MRRYLKEAFMVRVHVPPFGHVPVNAVAAAGFAILGFVNPGFWLLGAAVEAAVLSGLAFNERFQNLVDGLDGASIAIDAEGKRHELVERLPPASRVRLDAVAAKCARVLQVYGAAQADAFVLGTNREALRNLEWIYLKLLVAEANLLGHAGEDEQALARRIGELEADLLDPSDSGALRQSKTSTLDILKKRLALWRRREQSLDEIQSDLTRVEAQVDLLLENATLEGRPRAIDLEIDLATELAGAAVFGDAEMVVTEVDDVLAAHRRAAQAAAQKSGQSG
jgi:hypothetical protein